MREETRKALIGTLEVLPFYALCASFADFAVTSLSKWFFPRDRLSASQSDGQSGRIEE